MATINQPIFINEFAKGAQENASLGVGTLVGIDTYSKKGVAQLTKDTVKHSDLIVTDLIICIAAIDELTLVGQGETGKVYKTIDGGVTWTDISPGTLTGGGDGIIYYQGYFFAFRGTTIDYLSSPYGAGNWTQNWQTGLNSVPGMGHFPILFKNDNSVYFGNGNKVGKIGFGTAPTFSPVVAVVSVAYTIGTGSFVIGDTVTDTVTGATGVVVTVGSPLTLKNVMGTFNPGDSIQNGTGATATINAAGVSGSNNFFYQDNRLILPDQYTINCISYLPTNYLVLGTGSSNHPQLADIIRWNPTLSTFEIPLSLYATSADNGGGGVKQLINRNNTLYAVTAGNHCIFETNGTTFNLVGDISLRTNIRGVAGAQLTQPIFIFPHSGAIALMGNKLLTGTTFVTSNSPNGYFPSGIWTVAFTDSGQTMQCEYTISTGTVVAQHPFEIGAIFPTTNNNSIISWRDDTGYGVDLIQTAAYQNDINDVFIESEMMEIGTPIEPSVVQMIQLNLTRNLVTGQIITVNYRTSFDQNFALLQTFTVGTDGSSTGYKIEKNPIGATRFVQLQIKMATSQSLAPELTPEIRNIIIT